MVLKVVAFSHRQLLASSFRQCGLPHYTQVNGTRLKTGSVYTEHMYVNGKHFCRFDAKNKVWPFQEAESFSKNCFWGLTDTRSA